MSDHFSAIYANNGDDTFSNLGINMPALSDGDIAIGDINNDGQVDIFITGVNDMSETSATLLINEGSGSFSQSTFDFKGISFGKAAINDLNNDGLSDIILVGIDNEGQTILALSQLYCFNFV